MKKLLLLPFVLLACVFGQVSWQSPPWLTWAKTHKLLTAAFTLLLVIIISGWFYYQSLPQPLALVAEIHTPEAPDKNAKPDALRLYFYNPENSQKPAARIDLINSQVKKGVTIQPAIKGQWRFAGANSLVFQPEQHWPAGVDYQVQLSPDIFAKGSHLADTKLAFTTQLFSLQLQKFNFYQDPENSQIKKVVATVSASHPIDKQSFEKNIQLTMPVISKNKAEKQQAFAFTVTYDKYQQQAFIHSETISLPEQSNYMHLHIAPKVASLLGGKASEKPLEGKVVIPDIYSFLKVNEFKNHIVNDNQGTPWQTLSLNFTDAINKEQLEQHLQLLQLPQKGQAQGKKIWRSIAEVNDAVLAESQTVNYKILDTPRVASKVFHLQYQADENAYLYLSLAKGLSSNNQFVLAKNYQKLSAVPNYPKSVNIAGEGALLAFSGEHKLSMVSRGVPAIEYRIGKIRKDQLYHLVSQTEGDLQKASFQGWNFTEQQLAEIHTEVQHLKNASGKTLNYSSLDLSPYIGQETSDAGLFIIEAKGYDPKAKRYYSGATDKRLILLSDLGLLVKNNRNSSHDVFVQSIKTGLPVAGASIELLGQNGLPILTKTSNATGHAHFPPTQGFSNEQRPVVYLVQKGQDISFIPFDRYSTQINLSRFDIGGVYSQGGKQQASKAFMFTDRGIYRPGETAQIGAIVKTEGLANIANMPVEWVIENPRGQEVFQQKLLVPDKGLMDVSFSPDATAATGRYYARLHLLRDKTKHRGQSIGSVSFTVEDFEPDSLKITSRLKDLGNNAWFTGKNLQAEVMLANLFGSPAQQRRLQAEISISPSQFYFKKYADYKFDQAQLGEGKKAMRLNEPLPSLQTDKAGKGLYTIDLSRFQYGTYRLNFSVQGFAKDSGRSVASSNSTLVYPLDYLLGYKSDAPLNYIKRDSKRALHWLMINKQLKPEAFKTLTIKTLAIKTVSSLAKQNDGTYLYEDSQQEQLLRTENISLESSGKDWPLATDTVGDFVLEAYDDKGNRLARVPYSVVGEANTVANIEKQSPLQLKLDGDDFSAGDTLQMQIQAPFKGTGLITIESDRVHAYKWFAANKQSSLLSITVPEGLQGNAYVSVAFVRDSQSEDIFSQPLSYAVKSFTVNRKQHQTDLKLNVPEQVKPGDDLTIGYQSAKGNKLVIFAVDEGILQVANYQAPKPLDFYLQKRALGVSTLQILDLIMPEYSLLKRVSAPGGGASFDEMASAKKAIGKNLNPFSRELLKPVAFWSGVVTSAGKGEVVFTMPESFAGNLKIMAVAVGSSQLADASAQVLVRGPFAITPNVLQHAAPNDAFDASFTISNLLEPGSGLADVKVSFSHSKHLELLSPATQTLELSPGDEQSLLLKVKALEAFGNATLTAHVSYKDHQLSRTATLSVRPAVVFTNKVQSGFSDKHSLRVTNPLQLHNDLATQSISASPSPMLLLDGLNSYLQHFPHQCTEQMLSKAFSQMLLATQGDAGLQKAAREQFSATLAMLQTRQLSNGGFAYWPGQNTADDFSSLYAASWLQMAADNNYPVPQSMLQSVLSYLQGLATTPVKDALAQRFRAMAIYQLTLQGRLQSNALLDLRESLNFDKQAYDVTWLYMAASYQHMQQQDIAQSLLEQFMQQSQKQPVALHYMFSPMAENAQRLYLLAKHFSNSGAPQADYVTAISEDIFANRYQTLSAALAVQAFSALDQNAFNASASISFKAQQNNQAKALPLVPSTWPKALVPTDVQNIDISANQSFYYQLQQAGFSKQSASKAISEGLEIQQAFIDDKGQVLNTLERGKKYQLRLRIRSLEQPQVNEVAWVVLLPAGFMAENNALQTLRHRFNYVDLREDRVVLYLDVNQAVTEITLPVTATASGTFTVPSANARALYQRGLYGETPIKSIEVVAP